MTNNEDMQDNSRDIRFVALLLIDVINDYEFSDGEKFSEYKIYPSLFK